MKKKYLIILILILSIILLTGAYIYYRYYYKVYYPYSGNAPAINSRELECGAYYGYYNQKKPGTPDDWVWHEAGMSSGWTAPNGSISCLWKD